MKLNDTLLNIVANHFKHDQVPMLLGEPGIGKSSWAKELANLLGTKVFVLACNQLGDKTDLTGARMVPVKDENGAIIDYDQLFYPHAVINKAIRYANECPDETPILFLDEINRTTADITSALLSIPTDRSIGNKDLPANLKIIIAGNDKGNVTMFDQASISRFIKYYITPDVTTFFDKNTTLNKYVAGVLKANPNLLVCTQMIKEVVTDQNSDNDDMFIDDLLLADEGINQITVPRTITAISNFLNTLSQNDLIAYTQDLTQSPDGREISVLQEIIEGHTGQTLFSNALLISIMNDLANTVSTGNTSLTPPTEFYQLKTLNTRTDVDNMVATLSPDKQTAVLIYSLYNADNNASIIESILARLNKLQTADLQWLISNVNLLTQHNLQVALNSNTPVGNILSQTLS